MLRGASVLMPPVASPHLPQSPLVQGASRVAAQAHARSAKGQDLRLYSLTGR